MPQLLGNLGSVREQNLPEVLTGHINAQQWIEIGNSFSNIQRDSTLLVCAGEWLCCVCTGVFCIFFFHPSFEHSVANSKLDAECKRLNSLYFMGNHVFRNDGMSIWIDEQFIPNRNVNLFMVQAQPLFAVAQVQQPVYMQSPGSVYPLAIPVQMTPQHPQQPIRTAQYIVQANNPPGSQVTIQAPNGTLVMITVPNDARQGTFITYYY